MLEGLEDQALLVLRDADAGVGDGEPDDLGGRAIDPQVHPAALGELHRIREQIAEDLPQAHVVGVERRRQIRVEADRERQPLLLGDLAERLVDVVAQVGEPDLADVDRHGAGLDLCEIEDLVDQRHQIRAGLADGVGVADLLVGEVALDVVRERSSGDMFARNWLLYFEVSASCSAFSSSS